MAEETEKEKAGTEWIPKTELGRRVAKNEVVSIEQVFEEGKPILEHQIVDILLPNLKEETLEVATTNRMTDNGRKMKFRAVVLVGDGNGHLGIGVGKADEVRPAVESAAKDAKRRLIRFPLGCGSWECGCGERHTLPIKVMGKQGSVVLSLKPAPRGVGVVANEVVRKVLSAAGVKDAWSFAKGSTRNVFNTAMAVRNALDSLNHMRYKGEWESALKKEGNA